MDMAYRKPNDMDAKAEIQSNSLNEYTYQKITF